MNLTGNKKRFVLLACIFHLIILLSYFSTNYLTNNLNENNVIELTKCEKTETLTEKKVLTNNISDFISKEVIWKNGKLEKYDKKYCDKVATSIVKNAKYPLLTTGIIYTESKFNNKAKNKSSGALGLGQIHPVHKNELRRAGILRNFDELTNIDKNIKAINFVLNNKLKISDGNFDKALNYYSGDAENYNQKVWKKVRNLKLYCNNKNLKRYKYN